MEGVRDKRQKWLGAWKMLQKTGKRFSGHQGNETKPVRHDKDIIQMMQALRHMADSSEVVNLRP